MIFDGIYGHEDIKQRLEASALNDAVSHAYIFCGASGIGKTSIAKAFAKMLTQGSEADVIYVTNEYYGIKDKAALSVETVRAARVDIYTKPYRSDKKVFIFPKAETMTPGAQNALLKVFEEPPAYCVIILLAQNDNMLLPTIRSRAVTIRFSPLSDKTVERYLNAKYGKSDSVIIRLASGSIAAADSLMSQDGVLGLASEFSAIFQKFTGSDKTAVYEAISLFEREKSRYEVLLDIMGIMLSDILLNKNENNDIIKLSGIKTGMAVRIVDEAENARRALRSNRNYSIVISELLLEAWRTMHD